MRPRFVENGLVPLPQFLRERAGERMGSGVAADLRERALSVYRVPEAQLARVDGELEIGVGMGAVYQDGGGSGR